MSAIRAKYKQSFFQINLPFRVHEDVSLYTEEEFGRLVHEYVHFLQNFHTPWGLHSTCFYYKRLFHLFKGLRDEKPEEISLPYRPNLSSNIGVEREVITNGEGRRRTISGKNLDCLTFVPGSLSKPHRTTPLIGNRRCSHLTIDFNINENVKDSCEVGAWFIKESMAQIIQDAINPPQEPRKPVFPYDFVTEYCKQYAPSVAKDIGKQVVICWASLFSMTPSEVFFDLLDLAEAQPNSSHKALFKEYISRSRIRIKDSSLTFGTFMVDIRQRFLRHIEGLLQLPCSYFKQILSDLKITEVVDNLLSFCHLEDRKAFEEVLQTLGGPLIVGIDNSSSISYLEEDDSSANPMLLLFAFEKINALMESEDGVCPFKEDCQAEGLYGYDCVTPLMMERECPMCYTAQLAGVQGIRTFIEK